MTFLRFYFSSFNYFSTYCLSCSKSATVPTYFLSLFSNSYICLLSYPTYLSLSLSPFYSIDLWSSDFSLTADYIDLRAA